MSGALQSSRAAQTDQIGLLQPAHWSSHLRARGAVDWTTPGRSERRPLRSNHALVEQSGQGKSDKWTEETKLLHRCSRLCGRTVVHIWDRGFASSAWLHRVFQHDMRFILRWPKRYKLVASKGSRNAWKIARGKVSPNRKAIPLYHLRSTISRLWLSHPPFFHFTGKLRDDSSFIFFKRAQRDSNPRPSVPKTGTLSAELWAQ